MLRECGVDSSARVHFATAREMPVSLEHQGRVLVAEPLGDRDDALARGEQPARDACRSAWLVVPSGSPLFATALEKIKPS